MGNRHTMKKVTAIVIGAGNRGKNYSSYALDFPDRLKIVGVADPREYHRKRIQDGHKIPNDQVFESWEAVAERDKFADCVLITTPDRLHKDPAVAFANKGYHILLEKPMAVTYQDCCEIVEAAKKNNIMLAVCHVLRYTPQARKIKQLIESGAIGDVVNIQHLEPVGYFHFGHSYVRGNWRNVATSTFSLLAKSCHDLDLILYWMQGQACQAVSSFGSLKHFKKENKPNGAGSRCLDCAVEPSCPYSAKKLYIGMVKMGHTGWPVKVVADVPDIESVTEALKSGPYGRCVYECDNDVVDNQVVNMQFEGGSTVSFSMVAFTQKVCARQTNIFGTKGELKCDFDSMRVIQFDFTSEDIIVHDLKDMVSEDSGASRLQGHGGADFYAMDAFVEAVGMNDPSKVLTGPDETLASHFLTFAAEQSRLQNRVINPTKDKITI